MTEEYEYHLKLHKPWKNEKGCKDPSIVVKFEEIVDSNTTDRLYNQDAQKLFQWLRIAIPSGIYNALVKRILAETKVHLEID